MRNPVRCFHDLTGMQLENIQGAYFLRKCLKSFINFNIRFYFQWGLFLNRYVNTCLENRAYIYLKGNRIFLNTHIVRRFKSIYLDDQNQSFRGVLKKKGSENMQQVYTRTPMPKCDFNKVALKYAANLHESTHAKVRIQ